MESFIFSWKVVFCMENRLLELFHHIHHDGGVHKVHHCGGEHSRISVKLDYNIEHCKCGKHKVDALQIIGHDFEHNEVLIGNFKESCPEGGWHIESGEVIK